jgi:hypothetical protein
MISPAWIRIEKIGQFRSASPSKELKRHTEFLCFRSLFAFEKICLPLCS